MYWNVQHIVHVFWKPIIHNRSRPIVKRLECTNFQFRLRVVANFHLQLPQTMQAQVYLLALPSMVSTSRLSYQLPNSLMFLILNTIFLWH